MNESVNGVFSPRSSLCFEFHCVCKTMRGKNKIASQSHCGNILNSLTNTPFYILCIRSAVVITLEVSLIIGLNLHSSLVYYLTLVPIPLIFPEWSTGRDVSLAQTNPSYISSGPYCICILKELEDFEALCETLRT